jgi:hypothetical protein
MPSEQKTTAGYPRHYRSKAGSTVTVPRWGVWEMQWDWLEEGACCDARPSFDDDRDEPAILATCECCDEQRIPVLRCEVTA